MADSQNGGGATGKDRGSLMCGKRWKRRKLVAIGGEKKKVVKAREGLEKEKNAGNRREGKMGLGDVFKRVRRRWIRGGERARDNEREKERAKGMRR